MKFLLLKDKNFFIGAKDFSVKKGEYTTTNEEEIKVLSNAKNVTIIKKLKK
jgi:hypothetical protein